MKDRKIDIDKLNRDIYLLTVEDPEVLDVLLSDEGFDPNQLEINGIAQVKALLFQQTVALKKFKQNNIYTRALALFESAKESTREGIMALLQQRAPQLEFNNLSKMDEQDLKDILDETDLLDLMEKIEREEL